MRLRIRRIRPSLRSAMRLSHRFTLVAMIASLLALALPVAARNPNFRICLRQVINVPGPNFGQPPTIDGVINNDLGWTSAFRYVFGNGTPTPDGVIQGIRDATNIYLSFEVNNDQQFDNEDVIVLTVDPTGVAADAHRIHIFPVFTGAGAAVTGEARLIEHWTNSAAWTLAPALPAGSVKVTAAGVGPVSYFVEVKLARAAFSIPAAGDFGMYFNMIRVSPVGQPIGTAAEMFWPTDAPPIGLDLEGNTPPPNTWGNASLAGTCNGVSIDPSDITTNQTPSSKIAFPPASNIFNALVHNNTVDAGGAFLPANNVSATFKIANFGIPAFGDWALVPTGNNPKIGNIPANSSNTLSTDGWVLTAGQVTQYTAHTHQCILVELDSTDPNTFFVQKSAWTNMNFGTASVADFDAEISGRLKDKPPGGKANHQFDFFVTKKESVLRSQVSRLAPGEGAATQGLDRGHDNGEVDGAGAGAGADETQSRETSQLTWVAHGLRRTGNFIVIKKKKFEIVDRAGSYGFLVQHQGKVGTWLADLTGQSVRKVAENLYRTEVPHGKALTVHTRVEAFEPGVTPPPPKPPRKCGKAKSSVGGFFLLVGVFGLGLIAYAPRRRRKNRRNGV